MRFRLVTVAILLAIASRAHGRPRDPDPLDGSQQQEATTTETTALPTTTINYEDATTTNSRQDKPRELKDIQSMDQSLRTVATQLLNSTTKREDLVRISDAKIETLDDTPMHVVHVSTRVEDAVGNNQQQRQEEAESTTKMKFGIPVNSKFGHFEMVNPGQAMAITEEEYEKEMAAAHKNAHQTTAGMLSTWIQLYPPTTTTEGSTEAEIKSDIQDNQIPTTSSTKLPTNVFKNTANIKPVKKPEIKTTTAYVEKTTEPPPVSTTKELKVPTTTEIPNTPKINPTMPTTMLENNIEETETTVEKKIQTQKTTVQVSTTAKPTPAQKKSATKVGTTPKPKITGPKNATANKPSKASNKLKPPSTRRPPLSKNDTVTSTSRIEKVTFRPMSTSALHSTERPQFITKIKASVLTDTQKTTTVAPTTMKAINSILSKANFSHHHDSFHPKVPNPTRVNNVLKVHTKKPIDDSTKIEIQPIRVNPPVLTIQKFGDASLDFKDDDDILQNSKVDVKFDFKDAEIKTSTTELPPSTTTKKSKRKKNKRRRKPVTTTTLAPSSPFDGIMDDGDSTTISALDLDLGSQNGIQESKIEPESKEKPSKKKKHQNQNTQISNKPFGTQIYNFLSREVMPSVGVMSLVGLGLGLASYFLYPFGGGIARRNYDVDQPSNYKYNLDEYGGSHGLSEEEVLSKVYSGMTPSQHHQTKYGPGGKDPNYYRYTGGEQPQPASRYPPVTPTKNHGNKMMYRPVETTSYENSYQKTDFKYPDVQTTPNYYDRQRQPQQPSADYAAAINKPGLGNNRQFVVGNVPKEYSSGEVDKMSDIELNQASAQYQASDNFMGLQAKEGSFELPIQANENYNPMIQQGDIYNSALDTSQGAASAMESMGSPAALVSKVSEEQAPIFEQADAVSGAVEHGPRSLSFDGYSKLQTNRQKRNILPDFTGKLLPEIKLPTFRSARAERSSVIQVIPTKAELEKERKEQEEEEDLSNEILDIIDDTIPGHEEDKKKRHKELKEQLMKEKEQQQLSEASSTSTTEEASSTTSEVTAKQAEPSTTTTTTTAAPKVATTISSTTQTTPSGSSVVNKGESTTLDWFDGDDNTSTTEKPKPAPGFNIVGFAKKVAEFKLRLGLTILKHASEGLAKYIGHIQKRFNGGEDQH